MKYLETLKKLYRTPKLTAPFIVETFRRREETEVNVTFVDIGKPGFEIETDIGVFFLLEQPIGFYNKKWGRSTNMQIRISEFGIPIPLFLGTGEMSKSFHEASVNYPPMHSLISGYTIFLNPK
ncbi:hypothetical protein ACTWM0_19140 [Pseudomonas machongensis]